MLEIFMGYKSVRKGIVNAKINEESAEILYVEIGIISIILGLVTQSWWWWAGTFFGLIFALQIKPIAFILIIALSSVWGVIGYCIGSVIGSQGAMEVISLTGFIVGIGVHLSALEWVQDIE